MRDQAREVMIVEDDLLLLMVEERLVKKLGYQVVAKTGDGERALEVFREVNPEILIIDINLRGDLTGIDVVQRLRKEGSDVPVIFLSGEESPTLIKRLKQMENVEFLPKPITIDCLKKSLNKKAYNKNTDFVAA